MAKSATTTVSYVLTGDGQSVSYSDNGVLNTAATAPASFSLTSGNNTLAVPSTATSMTLIPPAGNAVALTLKGVAGDTGIALAPAQSLKIGLTAGAVANVVVNAGGSVTVQVLWG